MTNFEGSCFFNDCGLLDIFPDQIAFTKKVQSGNIKFIKIRHPSELPILPNLLRCKALEVLKVVWGTLRLASSANLAIA